MSINFYNLDMTGQQIKARLNQMGDLQAMQESINNMRTKLSNWRPVIVSVPDIIDEGDGQPNQYTFTYYPYDNQSTPVAYQSFKVYNGSKGSQGVQGVGISAITPLDNTPRLLFTLSDPASPGQTPRTIDVNIGATLRSVTTSYNTSNTAPINSSGVSESIYNVYENVLNAGHGTTPYSVGVDAFRTFVSTHEVTMPNEEQQSLGLEPAQQYSSYIYRNVSNLTIDNGAETPYPVNDIWLKFYTAVEGSSVSVTWPESWTFIGAKPAFGLGEVWEISVKDGVVVAVKVGNQSSQENNNG